MTITEAITLFIERKREAGFFYEAQGAQLNMFGRYESGLELSELTSQNIAEYLNNSQSSPYSWGRKRAQLSEFFLFWNVLGQMPFLELPPARAYKRKPSRPCIFTHFQIHNILQSLVKMQVRANNKVDRETLRTLILLLYGTGMRISEALALRPENIDFPNQMLHIPAIRASAGRKLPIGTDIVRLLKTYERWNRAHCLKGDFVLLTNEGSPITLAAAYYQIRKLLNGANIERTDGSHYKPRAFDLRSTFAVHQIEVWLKKKKDLNRLLPALAHYLGLRDLARTERFLDLAPERFRGDLQKLSPAKGSLSDLCTAFSRR